MKPIGLSVTRTEGATRLGRSYIWASRARAARRGTRARRARPRTFSMSRLSTIWMKSWPRPSTAGARRGGEVGGALEIFIGSGVSERRHANTRLQVVVQLRLVLQPTRR